MERPFRHLLVGALIVAAGACKSASKPGEESYSGMGGTLSKVLTAPFPDVYAATMAGMGELDLHPVDMDRDAFRAMIIGETVMGQISQTQEVRVWLTRMSDDTTKIEMRILGRRDQDRLKVILAEIERRLPKKPAAPPSAPPKEKEGGAGTAPASS